MQLQLRLWRPCFFAMQLKVLLFCCLASFGIFNENGKSGNGKSGNGTSGNGNVGNGKLGNGKSVNGKCGNGKCGNGKCGIGKFGIENVELCNWGCEIEAVQLRFLQHLCTVGKCLEFCLHSEGCLLSLAILAFLAIGQRSSLTLCNFCKMTTATNLSKNH